MSAYVLYDQEKKVLQAMIQYINRFGYAPTLREIAVIVGVSSPATIHEHVVNLLQKGCLIKIGRFKRGYDVPPELKKRETGEADATLTLPLFGYIAAGSPLEPHPDPNATFFVPASMVSSGKTGYVLQVKGDSMKDDGILDGDYVVIEYTDVADDGDIVIALLEESGMATLKRYYRENDRIVLKPANSEMQPIYARKVRIQGKVVGVVRKFV